MSLPTLRFLPQMPAGMPPELQSRIQFAYASTDLKPCERQVLYTLLYGQSKPRVGRAQAMRRTQMQAWWQVQNMPAFGERDIKAAVKSLIEEHGVPIGSARTSTPGYFLVASVEDLEAARGPIIAEIKSMAERCRVLDWRTSFARRVQGQEVLQ